MFDQIRNNGPRPVYNAFVKCLGSAVRATVLHTVYYITWRVRPGRRYRRQRQRDLTTRHLPPRSRANIADADPLPGQPQPVLLVFNQLAFNKPVFL